MKPCPEMNALLPPAEGPSFGVTDTIEMPGSDAGWKYVKTAKRSTNATKICAGP